MRFLVAGVVLVLLAVGLAEYDRRHPHLKDEAGTVLPTRPVLPAKVQALLETQSPPADAPAPTEPFVAVLKAPEGAPVNGFSPVLSGTFGARELRGGFGAVLFVVDANSGSAIVRAVAGEPSKVIAARAVRISTMQVDGSTVFFAEAGRVLSLSARGDDAPQVRVAFARADVTSLAAVGDTVYVALRARDSKDAAVARVDSDGTVALIAADQEDARGVVADGKDVFWVSGSSLWRASADASFSSRVSEDVEAPLALDGDGVVLRHGDELQRVGRAGGKSLVLAKAAPLAIAASSGLVRYAAADGVYEVTSGAEPVRLLEGEALGVALGGTGLYVLLKTAAGVALFAK